MGIETEFKEPSVKYENCSHDKTITNIANNMVNQPFTAVTNCVPLNQS